MKGEFFMYTIEIQKVANPKVNNNGYSTVGYANVDYNGIFTLRYMAIVQKPDGSLFVACPNYLTSKKDKDGKAISNSIYNPITAEFREELFSNVLAAFDSNVREFVCEENIDVPTEYGVRVTPYTQENSKLSGFASVYLDDRIVVSGIRLYDGQNGLMVQMPCFKTSKYDKDGNPKYKPYCFSQSADFREELNNTIKQEMEEQIKEQQKDQQQTQQQEKQQGGKFKRAVKR